MVGEGYTAGAHEEKHILSPDAVYPKVVRIE
jgi:hypothetical protein